MKILFTIFWTTDNYRLLLAFPIAVTSASELWSVHSDLLYLEMHKEMVLQPGIFFLSKVVSSFHLNPDIVLPFLPNPSSLKTSFYTSDVHKAFYVHHIASFRKYVKCFMCYQRVWKGMCISSEYLSELWPTSCWPVISKYSLMSFIPQDHQLLLPYYYKGCYCQTFLWHGQVLFTALQAYARVDASFRTPILSYDIPTAVSQLNLWVTHRNDEEENCLSVIVSSQSVN